MYSYLNVVLTDMAQFRGEAFQVRRDNGKQNCAGFRLVGRIGRGIEHFNVKAKVQYGSMASKGQVFVWLCTARPVAEGAGS